MKLDLNIGYCEKLDADGVELLQAVVDAHDQAARNNQNASSFAAVNACAGSGNIGNGIASAILTLGQHHGPISMARTVYEEFNQQHVDGCLNAKIKVPGFGNSFFKDSIDPAWNNVWSLIQSKHPKIAERINTLQSMLALRGKVLHPNAALFTAAVCSHLGFKHGTECSVFIIARIPAWTTLCIK